MRKQGRGKDKGDRKLTPEKDVEVKRKSVLKIPQISRYLRPFFLNHDRLICYVCIKKKESMRRVPSPCSTLPIPMCTTSRNDMTVIFPLRLNCHRYIQKPQWLPQFTVHGSRIETHAQSRRDCVFRNRSKMHFSIKTP